MTKSTCVLSICLVALLFSGCNGKIETASPSRKADTTPVSYSPQDTDCECDPKWFPHSQTPDTQQLIYAQGETTGLGGITWPSPQPPIGAYDLFQYGVPRTTGNDFMETSQEELKNFDHIQQINECVAKNLKDVWNNYLYNGSIWIDTDIQTSYEQAKKIVTLGDNIDSAIPGSPARGSLNCANVTMETYTQTFNSDVDEINVKNFVNCFTCHNAKDFRSGKTSSGLSVMVANETLDEFRYKISTHFV